MKTLESLSTQELRKRKSDLKERLIVANTVAVYVEKRRVKEKLYTIYKKVFFDSRTGRKTVKIISKEEWRNIYLAKIRLKITKLQILYIDYLIANRTNGTYRRNMGQIYRQRMAIYMSKISDAISKAPVQAVDFRADERHYKTNRGEYVRSKSEQIIANVLFECAVPYFYEYEMNINGKSFLPDFVIFDTMSGQTIYWEHFGMLHDSVYCAKMADKLMAYADLRIEMNENLIATFEGLPHYPHISAPFIREIVDRKILETTSFAFKNNEVA